MIAVLAGSIWIKLSTIINTRNTDTILKVIIWSTSEASLSIVWITRNTSRNTFNTLLHFVHSIEAISCFTLLASLCSVIALLTILVSTLIAFFVLSLVQVVSYITNLTLSTTDALKTVIRTLCAWTRIYKISFSANFAFACSSWCSVNFEASCWDRVLAFLACIVFL